MFVVEHSFKQRCDVFVKKPAFEGEQERKSVVPRSLFSLDVLQRCERYFKRQLSVEKNYQSGSSKKLKCLPS